MKRRNAIILLLALFLVPLIVGVVLIWLDYYAFEEHLINESLGRSRSASYQGAGERRIHPQLRYSIVWPESWQIEEWSFDDRKELWAADQSGKVRISMRVGEQAEGAMIHDLFLADSLEQAQSDDLFDAKTAYAIAEDRLYGESALLVELANPGIGDYPKPKREFTYYSSHRRKYYIIRCSLPWADYELQRAELEEVIASFRFE